MLYFEDSDCFRIDENWSAHKTNILKDIVI